MSERVAVTLTPVQITDGTNSAHVTVSEGFIEYADSADSEAWHRADRVINVSPPVSLYLRVASGQNAAAVVTTFTE